MRTVAMMVLFLAAGFAFAAGDGDVTYTGGTAPQMKEGSVGKFDFSSAGQLRFISASATLEIPFAGIESFEHTREAAVHLGVAPAVAVGLIAARRHNHFVRITYKDSNQLPQVVVFEVPKAMTSYLIPTLEARAPQVHCAVAGYCTPRPIVQQPLPAGATTGSIPAPQTNTSK